MLCGIISADPTISDTNAFSWNPFLLVIWLFQKNSNLWNYKDWLWHYQKLKKKFQSSFSLFFPVFFLHSHVHWFRNANYFWPIRFKLHSCSCLNLIDAWSIFITPLRKANRNRQCPPQCFIFLLINSVYLIFWQIHI